MNAQLISKVSGGVIPVVPTVFNDDESLDSTGQRRVVDFLLDTGAKALCVLANFSEQFALSDDERSRVLDATFDTVDGRLPVVVTTSHFSARVTRDRNLAAEARGASMVMTMPPFFGATMAVDEQQVLRFFQLATEGLSIPVMIQDAPLSTTRMSPELIARISREVAVVSAAKVEAARAADKIRRLSESAPDTLPLLFDGEEGVTLIPDLDAGAIGCMTSSLAPEKLARIVALYSSEDHASAATAWQEVLPLLQFENRQCGLAAAKTVLCAGGIIASDATRAPLVELSSPVRASLMRLAHEQDLLALSWAS